MSEYVHAEIFRWATNDYSVEIYENDGFTARESFEFKPDAFQYLQKQGFRLVSTCKNHMFFVKEVNS